MSRGGYTLARLLTDFLDGFADPSRSLTTVTDPSDGAHVRSNRWPSPDTPGTIYLLHYSGTTRQGRRHYLGWSANAGRRYAEHTTGNGCRETHKPVAQGLKLMQAQTWDGTPRLERAIKEWRQRERCSFAGLCPFCEGGVTPPTELLNALGAPSLTRRWLPVVAHG